ncbi:hypothetical protein TWF569_006884 [Orbilia oligospora]|uniref:MACPF domain-containing protein n=1 Tax=Orbilia oligospora TaxID=2813651 RepID=A0A7C8NYA9_ORBOL|nr:hypothetical protein TWF102_001108 [Orbilia oligospora]KAF3116612.1 hypothetical protein TWF103_008375 [Orbilia oligospora]KAF3134993.1 hypothetical protein TWF594_008602 [Orbilia oligospora]KAF3135212.1 hypothetical protein TWF703_006126 [Orbilia oligospora]KAF3156303.1 hypothetical protein TWF569_006884 [Orbilia oligospora]
MATHLVPYNTAMQLGSGFNSFTQTLCINNAVVRETETLPGPSPAETGQSADLAEKKHISQSVTYKTSIIKKTTDVTNMMNINGAFTILNDQLKVEGSGKFIDTNIIKDSDFSVMVSVKVVNQVIYDHSLTKFQPIPNIKDMTQRHLVEIYGDSFISGWQEGGEFLAVLSIKAKERGDGQEIAAQAKIAFTRGKGEVDESDPKKLKIKLDAKFEKMKDSLINENEVSVSVAWTGGGQNLKHPEKDWDFNTMRDVALKFPDLCAKTPMRTHALLTKYTALRSFYTTQLSFDLPVYDKTGTYTNILEEAYLDYKAILGTIQVLAYGVCEGKKALVVNPRSASAVEQTKAIIEKTRNQNSETSTAEAPPTTDVAPRKESTANSTTSVVKAPARVINSAPLLVTDPFPVTIAGLEEARLMCRYMMNRIVQEINNITIKPEIANDESRPLPFQSPFLFKLLLPIAVDVELKSTYADQAVAASTIDPDVLASKFTSVAQ